LVTEVCYKIKFSEIIMYKKYSIKTTKNKSDAGKTMSDDSQELSTPTTMGTTAPEKLTGTECE